MNMVVASTILAQTLRWCFFAGVVIVRVLRRSFAITSALQLCLILAVPGPALASNDPSSALKQNLAADPHLFEDVIKRASNTDLTTLYVACGFSTDTRFQLQDTDKNSITAPQDSDAPAIREKLINSLVNSTADYQDSLAKQNARTDFLQRCVTSLEILSKAYVQAIATREYHCSSKRPRIHNIGMGAIVAFESAQRVRPARAGERSVRIPIDGYDLDPLCVSFGIQIGGTVQTSRYGQAEKSDQARDFWVTEPTADSQDLANIVLLEPYIDRLKTGDILSVSVSASNRYAKPNGSGARRVSYAKRTFAVYEIEDYRKLFLASRVAPHDFAAFPLPKQEAEGLFGPLIAENYFVVRLSIRNTDAEAKLVSTGMIRATGSALIEPKDPNNPNEPTFAVPVTVVPHSLQQIYALLKDEEVAQRRSVVIRGLEMFGALATGVSAITSAGAQAVKNLGFFTGIGIPEFRKFWTDREPGYQRNIVNFAMPDLLKVAANSVADHKFLFFSKRELDGLVSDPNLYGIQPSGIVSGSVKALIKPDAYVISLGFDNLDIRFEKVFQVATITVRDQILELMTELPKENAVLIEAKQQWITSSNLLFGLSTADWDAAASTVGAIVTAIPPAYVGPVLSTDEVASLHTKIITPIRKILGAVDYHNKKDSALVTDLYGPGPFASGAISNQLERVRQMSQRLTAGADAEAYRDQVDDASKALSANKAVVRFYRELATFLQSHLSTLKNLKDALDALSKAGGNDDAAKKGVTAATAALVTAIDGLVKAQPSQGLSLTLN